MTNLTYVMNSAISSIGAFIMLPLYSSSSLSADDDVYSLVEVSSLVKLLSGLSSLKITLQY